VSLILSKLYARTGTNTRIQVGGIKIKIKIKIYARIGANTRIHVGGNDIVFH